MPLLAILAISPFPCPSLLRNLICGAYEHWIMFRIALEKTQSRIEESTCYIRLIIGGGRLI
jgi:hypothetical protein